MHSRRNIGGASVRVSSYTSAGRIAYLSGGTTGRPKVIHYDARRLARSVEVTRQILSAHSVGNHSRVAICQPFDPWSIGAIFRDAAMACGATVLPLGLNVTDSSLWQTFVNFRPTVLCGSASLLLSLNLNLVQSDIRFRRARRLVVHAGESLNDTMRIQCSDAWNARVVDVYGSAEFDSIASEGVLEGELILCPEFEHAISQGTGKRPAKLATDRAGELLMRERGAKKWSRTFDLVTVLQKAGKQDGLWSGSWKIKHHGRTDHSLTLADGTIVRSVSLSNLMKKLPIRGIQLHWTRRAGLSEIDAWVATHPDESVSVEDVRHTLLEECFELADSLKHGATKLLVKFTRLEHLHKTRRGQVAPFVEH